VVRGWIARRKFEKDLRDMLKYTGDEDLLMTSEEIRRRDSAKMIMEHMWKYYLKKKRNREREAAALRIQTYYKMRFVKNSSFVNRL